MKLGLYFIRDVLMITLGVICVGCLMFGGGINSVM